MADESRDPGLERVGRALRGERGACPEVERLVARARGELPAADAGAIDRHVALCAACQELLAIASEEGESVDEVTWRRAERGLDRRAAPWTVGGARGERARPWLGAVAALLVTGLAVGLWLGRAGPPPGPAPAATRGSALRPLAPVGAVAAFDAFRWQAPPVALRFEVEVERAGEVVWRGQTDASPLPAPPELRELLANGAPHRWRVRALAEDGRAVLVSEWAALELSPPAP